MTNHDKQILPKMKKAPFVTREKRTNSIIANLSITIKCNQFVGNKYSAYDFLKKQRTLSGVPENGCS